MIDPQPKLCQISEPTNSGRNQRTLLKKWTGEPPNASMNRLTTPFTGDRKLTIMPTTITVDMKCGRYDTDCTKRL